MISPRRSRRSLVTSSAIVTAIVISLTLVVAGYFAGNRWLETRQNDSRDLLRIVSQVVATNSSAAMIFNDRRAANETLASLADYPDIIQAVVYSPDHQQFASYQRADIPEPLPTPAWQPAGLQTTQQALALYQPVEMSMGEMGTLVLVADTSPLQQWITSTLIQLAMLILLAAVASLILLYLALRPLLISPLQDVLLATRRISTNRDYSIRLSKRREDEIGEVIDAINTMLATIEAHAKDLGAALTKAENADQAKSVFLSTMSHELRTPLNGVLGMAELLQLTELTAEQQKYVEHTRNSGKDLLSILNDILDFSKIEAQHLELENIAFDIHEAVEMVTGLFQQQAQSKDILLRFEIDPAVPRWFVGDPVRFRQIVANLVSNAVKFTSAGTIKVSLSINSDDDSNGIQLQVADTGIGIDSSMLTQIFSAFSQADSSTTRQYGGTGLGLAIATQLAKLMYGSIEVKSELGKGTTFTLRINLPTSSEKKTSDLPEVEADLVESTTRDVDVEVKSVLLAEDNQINQTLGRSMLEEIGVQVTTVKNGLEVLKTLENSKFDLVLMDGEMPQMDGYEATRQLRLFEQQNNRPRHVVVALTANAMNEARQQCLAAGMDDYMSKPYTLANLRAIIERWT